MGIAMKYIGFDDKLKFEGEFLNGERNGKGKKYDYYEKIIIEGEFKDGKIHEKLKEYYKSNKLKFVGEYLNGERWKGKEYN